MINFDDVTKGNIRDYDSNSWQIPDHRYRILIIGGSWSGKANSLLNLKNHEPDINKFIYMLKIHIKQNINC